jgi:site-specific recombinase XerD
VNDQLQEMIDQFPRIDNELGLMFPSVKNKSYIDQHNFSNRIFKPVVSRLVVDDLIEKYLPSYNLRHSFITRLIQSGVDIASVAKISGNSVEVILQSYYASNDDVKIPRLIW